MFLVNFLLSTETWDHMRVIYFSWYLIITCALSPSIFGWIFNWKIQTLSVSQQQSDRETSCENNAPRIKVKRDIIQWLFQIYQKMKIPYSLQVNEYCKIFIGETVYIVLRYRVQRAKNVKEYQVMVSLKLATCSKCI